MDKLECIQRKMLDTLKQAKEETLIDKADEVASGWIVEIKVQFEIQFEILEFIGISNPQPEMEICNSHQTFLGVSNRCGRDLSQRPCWTIYPSDS